MKRRNRAVWGVVLAVSLLGAYCFAAEGKRTPKKEETKKEQPKKKPTHLESYYANPEDNPKLPNVLIIGDSISLGYTIPVRKLLDGKADVFRPLINCGHSGFGATNIEYWVGYKTRRGKQHIPVKKWDVIHFNFGIWDTHIMHGRQLATKKMLRECKKGELKRRHTTEEYIDNLKKIIATLKKTGAKLIWASTTPCSFYGEADDTDSLVVKNNKAAKELMEKNGIAVNDLYAHSHPHLKEWQKPDGCHFSKKGKAELAKKVASVLSDALKERPKSSKPAAGK